eukprot:3436177-Prymnesium_polylepis.1
MVQLYRWSNPVPLPRHGGPVTQVNSQRNKQPALRDLGDLSDWVPPASQPASAKQCQREDRGTTSQSAAMLCK